MNRFHRRIAAILVCACATTQSMAALSSKSYVHEGLLLHWDGIENTGTGLPHDNAATVWKDLSGNGLDMTIPQQASFTDTGLETLRAYGSDVVNGRIPEKDHAIRAALQAARFTTEIVCNMTNAYHKQTVVMLILGNTSCFIGAYNNYENRIGFSPNGTGYLNGTAPTVFADVVDDDKTGLQQFICRQDGCSASVRLYSARRDHTYTSRKTFSKFDPDIATSWKLKFNRAYNQNCGLNGRYHTVRIYNRALSDDEAAVNQTIDRIRYFGDDPSRFTLPDGWKFETADGDLKLFRYLRIDAVDGASEAAGGTVSVDGDGAAAESGCWCEQGEGITVSLKAVPDDGHVFCGWVGVDDAVKYDPEITVTIARPVKAVFRKADGSDTVARTWTGAADGDIRNADNWSDVYGLKGAPDTNDAVTVAASATLTLAEPALFDSVRVEGTLVLTNWTTYLNAKTVTVADDGVITCGAPAKTMDEMSRIWIKCTDLTVEAGGSVTASQKGYFGWPYSGDGGKGTLGWGPGSARTASEISGENTSNWTAPSHGGYGARLFNSEKPFPTILPYDDPAAPELPGSSGGSNEYGHGGHGGGAVRIEATGTVTVDGSVLADGRNCSSHGGNCSTSSNHGQPGAGGSIFITCGSIAGSGVIRAAGGCGDNPKLYRMSNGANGVPALAAGGGMIAIHYDPAKQTGAAVAGMTVSAAAGLYKTTAYTTTCFNADFNHWEADIGTLHFTDGTLLDQLLGNGLTGQIRGLASYARGGDLVFTSGHVRFAEEGVAVSIGGDLSLGGTRTARLEIGGAVATNRSAFVDLWAGRTPCTLTVGGDLTLEGASRLDVRAAATDGNAPFGAVVTVSGAMTVGSHCVVNAIGDPVGLAVPKFAVGSLTVASNAVLTASGRGGRGGYAFYDHAAKRVNGPGTGVGPGRGEPNAGASHGGIGGSKGARPVYGDMKRPLLPGSGGCAGSQRVIGGAGGGLVYVSATNGSIVVDGEISADGTSGITKNTTVSPWGYGGGGSGGSILLEAKTFRLGETGVLSARGGDTEPYSTIRSGSGGGGRIAVWCGQPWSDDLPRPVLTGSETPLDDGESAAAFDWRGTCTVAAGEAVGQYAVPETTAQYVRSAGEDGTTWFGFVREGLRGFWMIVR